jgi:holliday junction DNA helicase RuvA
MIGKLRGKIDSCFEDYVIIDVGGIGYQVYCSTSNLHRLIVGEFCQLFIETHVREDHIHLYGFLTVEEKSCFNLLQLVSGIGARMALAILSALSPNQIAIAVSMKDKEVFRSISGVGHKLAERILIELKDKITINNIYDFSTSNNVSANPIAFDAISALTNLGINRLEAQNSVSTILGQNQEISIDELIRLAIKERGSNG